MRIPRTNMLVALLVTGSASAWSQGSAALDQLLLHHSLAEVDQMRENTHYRYEGELLFYAASFLIEENGQERPATEDEISVIDLHAYDGIRMEDQRTGVHDPLLDKHVVLLARREFERLVVAGLNEVDREAYLAYKHALLVQPVSKMP